MEQQYERDEIEIDLKQLFFVLWDKKWMIVLSGLILALAAFLVTRVFLTPVYASTATVYVMNRQSENAASSSDISAATSLTKDFEAMVTSRTVMEQVIDQVGLDMTTEELEKLISVSNPTDTRLLDITVEHESPEMAKEIVDCVASVASVQIVEMMGIEKVNIVDQGGIAENPSSPNTMRNVLIAGVIGVFIAAFFIVLRHLLDDTIKTSEDVEKYLGLSVLGVIPKNEGDTVKKSRPVKKTRRNKR